MSGYPANWHVYVSGDPVLKPRRRRVFYTGRRRGSGRMARLTILLALLLAAVSIVAFHGGSLRMREVAMWASR